MFLIEQQVSPYADLIKQSTKTKTLTMQWLMIFTCWSGHMCLFRISEKLKNNGHLAAGRQSREVPLHLKKLCKLRPKKKERKTRDRTAEELLMSFSSRTHVEPPDWRRVYKTQQSLWQMLNPLACSSYFEVMVLLIFWFYDYRERRVEKVRSQCGPHPCVSSFK